MTSKYIKINIKIHTFQPEIDLGDMVRVQFPFLSYPVAVWNLAQAHRKGWTYKYAPSYECWGWSATSPGAIPGPATDI